MDHALKTLSYFEIPNLIRKASPFGGRVAQPAASSRVSQIKEIDIDVGGNLFIQLREKLPVETGRPLTVNLNYRDMSFFLDAHQFEVHDLTLVSALPKRARAIDDRGSDRYVLPAQEKIIISSHRVEKRGGSTEFEAKIIDISREGLGIMISCPEENLLQKNDHLWIRSLNMIKLDPPLFARVVYVFERKFLNGSELKAGLQLSGELPDEHFLELRRMCKLVLKS